MRAIALVCLGMTILVSEASAETRTKPAQPIAAATSAIRTGSTNLNLAPSGTPYAIIANSGDRAKRSFAVQLERRVTETDLKRIATDIRLTDLGIKDASAVVMFYLPGMKLGHGVWAHAFFPATDAPEQKATQEPKVTIVGLSIAEEERLVLTARQDSRNIVGAWLTAAPAPVGKLTLYREKGRLFSEWGLRDGARFSEEVVETALPEGGWRYDRRDGGAGDHMRMTPEGDLQLRDRHDVVTGTQTIRRQPGDFNLAIANTNQSKSADIKLNQTKITAEKSLLDRSESKKPVTSVGKGNVITTIGSVTTTASGTDNTVKTKTASPTEQPDPDSLANVTFR
jgi:hypothetical protein